jgi:predicted NBD/HSP70 family sugar kinase
LARYRESTNDRNGATTNFGDLIDLALGGEAAARTALKETAKYLGIGIANLIRGLAPEAVIVGGPIVRAWPVISADIRSTVEATICRGLPSTRIIASTLGPEPTLMGALSLVLASKFASVSVT